MPEGYSVSTVVGLAVWAILAGLVASYTFKAFKETAP